MFVLKRNIETSDKFTSDKKTLKDNLSQFNFRNFNLANKIFNFVNIYIFKNIINKILNKIKNFLIDYYKIYENNDII